MCNDKFMVIEVAERLDAVASELLACVNRGDSSSEELLSVLTTTKAVRAKLDAAQAAAAATVAGRQRHGDGGAHVLATSVGLSRREAGGQVKTAQTIGLIPNVRDAVEDGRVSFANAKHLADAREKTSDGAIDSDTELLAKAESMQPEHFAKEAKQWAAKRQADSGESEYRRQRARRRVRIWNSDDGMVHLHGEFDPVTGRRIGNRLKKEARRLHEADKKQTRAVDRRHTRSFDQCMADALDNATSGAARGQPHADIALVARLDQETEELMVSTADGDPLPPTVIDRLAGNSSLFGLVLSAKGVPIWKGRNIKKATKSQFQALLALYGGCAGCAEPDPDMLQAHHIRPCAWGGTTDLKNMMPLCWDCHDKIHDYGWTVVVTGNGNHTIRPPNPVHYGPANKHDSAPPFVRAQRPDVAASEPVMPVNNENRASPSGPQAARAALRRAQAAKLGSIGAVGVARPSEGAS